MQAGSLAGQQLQAVGLVVAGQGDAPGAALADGQTELLRPASGGLLQTGDAERHMMQTPDHAASTRTGIRLTPLKKFERSRSGGPVSSILAPRDSSSSKVMRISS